MSPDSCAPLKEGEILHAEQTGWPLFDLTIHGSALERIKCSRRLVCALKNLPLRLRIRYEPDPRRSVEQGIGADPTLCLGDEILVEGLASAEELAERFAQLLEDRGAR